MIPEQNETEREEPPQTRTSGVFDVFRAAFISAVVKRRVDATYEGYP